MKELHQKALKAYIEMLTIHIDTKTSDTVFHNVTEGFYETLFEVAHKIGERHVDLGGTLLESNLMEKKKQTNSIIENLRKDIEIYKQSNKISLGTEDLLGSLNDRLENIEGSAKALLK